MKSDKMQRSCQLLSMKCIVTAINGTFVGDVQKSVVNEYLISLFFKVCMILSLTSENFDDIRLEIVSALGHLIE